MLPFRATYEPEVQAAALSLLPPIAFDTSRPPWVRVREALAAFPLKVDQSGPVSDGSKPERALLVADHSREGEGKGPAGDGKLQHKGDALKLDAARSVDDTSDLNRHPSSSQPALATGATKVTAIQVDDDDDEDQVEQHAAPDGGRFESGTAAGEAMAAASTGRGASESLAILFVAAWRALHIPCRLVQALRPLSHKVGPVNEEQMKRTCCDCTPL